MMTRVQPLPQAPHIMDLSQSQSIRRTISLSPPRETMEPPSPPERVSLLMDIDVAEAEVTPVRENRDQPGSEFDD